MLALNRIHLKKKHDRSIFTILIEGKLGKEDYNEFVPQLEWQITTAGKIHLLIELIDFHGWTLPGFWEEVKFAVKHFDHIGKIAVIGGGRAWERGMTSFFKPFTRAKVRFFQSYQKQTAQLWIEEEDARS
ncbi:MAG: STAS/SEC14 domain-containing protein [Desulfobacteraceae bacterium]|nr:MAG: STAS/SEC14 domain-containing protein [Desulfobacteraceae bacterium]